jgi:membrane protease YdiL (CAAX protease family)
MNEDKKRRSTQVAAFAMAITLGAAILASGLLSLVRDHDAKRLQDWPIWIVCMALIVLGVWGFLWHKRKYRLEDERERESGEAIPRPGLLGQALVILPTLTFITVLKSSSVDGFLDNLPGVFFFGIFLWVIFRAIQSYKP